MDAMKITLTKSLKVVLDMRPNTASWFMISAIGAGLRVTTGMISYSNLLMKSGSVSKATKKRRYRKN